MQGTSRMHQQQKDFTSSIQLRELGFISRESQEAGFIIKETVDAHYPSTANADALVACWS